VRRAGQKGEVGFAVQFGIHREMIGMVLAAGFRVSWWGTSALLDVSLKQSMQVPFVLVQIEK
jgi:hypothetical protein